MNFLKLINQKTILAILKYTFFSCTALTFCLWILRVSNILSNTKYIHISLFFKIIFLIIVSLVNLILPIALVIAIVIVVKNMIKSKQIDAINSLAISTKSILKPIMISAFICAIFMCFCEWYVIPKFNMMINHAETLIKNDITPDNKSGEIFSSKNFSVFAQKYINHNEFENVFIIDNTAKNSNVIFIAKKIILRNNKLILLDGERIEFTNQKHTTMYFAEYTHDISDILHTIKTEIKTLDEKTLPQLIQKKQKSIQDIAHIVQKFINPIMLFIYAMITFIFLTKKSYSRYKKLNNNSELTMSFILILHGVLMWFTNLMMKNLTYSYALCCVVGFWILGLFFYLTKVFNR